MIILFYATRIREAPSPNGGKATAAYVRSQIKQLPIARRRTESGSTPQTSTKAREGVNLLFLLFVRKCAPSRVGGAKWGEGNGSLTERKRLNSVGISVPGTERGSTPQTSTINKNAFLLITGDVQP